MLVSSASASVPVEWGSGGGSVGGVSVGVECVCGSVHSTSLCGLYDPYKL